MAARSFSGSPHGAKESCAMGRRRPRLSCRSLGLCLAATLALSGVAAADVVTIDMDQTYNGTSPAGTPAFAAATFASQAPGTVTLTMTNLMTPASGQFIDN